MANAFQKDPKYLNAALDNLHYPPGNVPPARSCLDEQEAYAANEIAINWNAPPVFLLAGGLAGR